MRRSETVRVLADYGRGLAGGLLFGLPILLTAEVWHEAFVMSPTRIVLFLLVQVVLLLGLVWVSGFKRRREMTSGQVALEAVQTMGLALVESAFSCSSSGRCVSGCRVWRLPPRSCSRPFR